MLNNLTTREMGGNRGWSAGSLKVVESREWRERVCRISLKFEPAKEKERNSNANVTSVVSKPGFGLELGLRT